MTSFYIWIAAAVVLFIVEIVTFTVVCLCLSVGAIAAAFAALGHCATWIQWAVFAVATLLSFVFIRPLVIRSLKHRSGALPRTNVDALVGKTGRVVEPIAGHGEAGRIAIDGDNWQALSADDAPIAAGAKVEVVSVESIVLTVRPVQQPTANQ